jgi:nucleotide-binding universal stress UspA family protein
MTGSLNVLWATDGSDHSEHAMPLLRNFVLPATGKLTVLTVAPQTFLGSARPDPAFLTRVTAASRRKALLEAEDTAQRWLTELDPGRVAAEAISRWGHPVQEILKASRSAKADLVVMGAKGHSNLHLLVLGSVVQGVVQLSPQPLLIARPGASAVRRILVGFDGSAPARKAIRFLTGLSLSGPTEVQLVHVLDSGDGRRGSGKKRGRDETGGAEERRHAEAKKSLVSCADSLVDCGLDVRVEIAVGPAAARLQEIARDEKADLIVVGSRKPSAAAHYLIGSTAEKLVRHAPTSVLVVR